MIYVRCAEEGSYERRLHFLVNGWAVSSAILQEDSLCVFDHPYFWFDLLFYFY